MSTNPPVKRPLGPQDMRRILAVTDALGIHRESVAVPLLPRGDGQVQVSDTGRVEIVAAEGATFEDWLLRLPQAITAMDLSRVRRAT